jgi:hypothetical protein
VPKWEYRLITIATEMEKHKQSPRETPKERDQRIENSLSDMGSEGWELVALMPAAHIVRTINPWLYHAVFKRAKEEN